MTSRDLIVSFGYPICARKNYLFRQIWPWLSIPRRFSHAEKYSQQLVRLTHQKQAKLTSATGKPPVDSCVGVGYGVDASPRSGVMSFLLDLSSRRTTYWRTSRHSNVTGMVANVARRWIVRLVTRQLTACWWWLVVVFAASVGWFSPQTSRPRWARRACSTWIFTKFDHFSLPEFRISRNTLQIRHSLNKTLSHSTNSNNLHKDTNFTLSFIKKTKNSRNLLRV